jgi:hypothetical protein
MNRDELIEKVSQVIWLEYQRDAPAPFLGRAAVAAVDTILDSLMEPSDRAVNAGIEFAIDAEDRAWPEHMRGIWKAMIQHIKDEG